MRRNRLHGGGVRIPVRCFLLKGSKMKMIRLQAGRPLLGVNLLVVRCFAESVRMPWILVGSRRDEGGVHPQRLLRSDAGTVPGLQRGLRRLLEGEDRPGGRSHPVARRLGQAGPGGDRRLGGRRGHAGPGLRHRRDRREGRAAAGRLAEAAAAQQLPLHLDDRVPGAQGQSQRDQGLGRPGQAGRGGDHAQSEDLRRGALELPGGLGLRAEAGAGRP